MFAPKHAAKLPLVLSISAATPLWLAVWCNFAHADEPPEVRGVIAAPVHFEGDAREQLTAACFELLAKCTFRHTATEAEWASADRGCHLSFKFKTPRTVAIGSHFGGAAGKGDKVEVAEMVIPLPLESARVWIRSGDEYLWFAKWPGLEGPRLYAPIQQLLKEAILD